MPDLPYLWSRFGCWGCRAGLEEAADGIRGGNLAAHVGELGLASRGLSRKEQTDFSADSLAAGGPVVPERFPANTGQGGLGRRPECVQTLKFALGGGTLIPD